MRASELRKKSTAELGGILDERIMRGEELARLLNQKKQKNVKELGAVKKDIARIKTIIGELR